MNYKRKKRYWKKPNIKLLSVTKTKFGSEEGDDGGFGQGTS